MKILHEVIEMHSKHGITFEDVTEKVKEIVKKSGIMNGLVTVYSQHTSCSVFIQEDSEGQTYAGTSLILQDTVNCLEKIIQTILNSGSNSGRKPKLLPIYRTQTLSLCTILVWIQINCSSLWNLFLDKI